ncbi:MAG: endonuclease/exonuclease/phosphatase family protein [Kiritimatiellaeota bacterium]|nr:endonuclease/exonuclease/phosphatase family protein [Kiritimatiellota bacterium]
MVTRRRVLGFVRLVALCAATGWMCGCERAAVGQGGGAITSATLRVASWNVENLFDTENDPTNPGDNEYTPTGRQLWTEEVYRIKLERLAELIAEMKPDIIGLAEIENRRVLVDLQKVLADAYDCHLPEIVHREGNDHRSIEVALLSKYKPTDTRWLIGNPTGREMICATFSTGASELTVIMCHWKSKLIPAGMTEQDVDNIRIREAKVARRAFERKLRKNPGAAVMVMGDFNDDVTSPILTRDGGLLVSRGLLKTNPTCLYNLSADIPANRRGTYYYYPKRLWNSLDSISVSPAMLDASQASTWTVQEGSYQIFKYPEHLDANSRPKSFRLVRPKDADPYYIYGYSDHFPVTVTLERGMAEERQEAGDF